MDSNYYAPHNDGPLQAFRRIAREQPQFRSFCLLAAGLLLLGIGYYLGNIGVLDTLFAQRAIKEVLARDHELAEETSGDIESVVAYADAVSRIDLSGCPTDFQIAFAMHAQAWRSVASMVKDADIGRVSYREAFNFLKDEEERMVVASAADNVRDEISVTWLKVRELAKRYHVATEE